VRTAFGEPAGHCGHATFRQTALLSGEYIAFPNAADHWDFAERAAFIEHACRSPTAYFAERAAFSEHAGCQRTEHGRPSWPGRVFG
jgi:hypothetical protein